MDSKINDVKNSSAYICFLKQRSRQISAAIGSDIKYRALFKTLSLIECDMEDIFDRITDKKLRMQLKHLYERHAYYQVELEKIISKEGYKQGIYDVNHYENIEFIVKEENSMKIDITNRLY